MVKFIRINLLFLIVCACLIIKGAGLAFGFSQHDIPPENNRDFCANQNYSGDKIEINESLLNALIMVESANNPWAFEKSSGAQGLTQIRKIAWKDLVRHYPDKYKKLQYAKDIFQPELARQAGKDYLVLLKYYLAKKKIGINLDNLLAAYNWGIGNLERFGLENAPKETQNYIKKIKSCLAGAEG